MSRNGMQRVLLALAIGWTLLLAACGSSTIESQLQPARVIAFGDGFSDLGQTGFRHTVNDGGANIWSQVVATGFGVNLTTAAAGGTSYATASARINRKPDAVGSNATPTVKEQIDSFLAANSVGSSDLVLISGGIGDIVAEAAQLNSGTQTSSDLLANVRQAGRDLGAQVRRLVQAGATHVTVTGTYDLGRSPWAAITGQDSLLSQASGQFNEQLLLSIVDLGADVLYVDAALLFNLMIGTPAGYDISNATDVVCTSRDPGVGIGIGAGQVNSALCNLNTLLPGADYTRFLFADAVYPTPLGHVKFGQFAFERIRARW